MQSKRSTVDYYDSDNISISSHKRVDSIPKLSPDLGADDRVNQDYNKLKQAQDELNRRWSVDKKESVEIIVKISDKIFVI
jgi:hypothetical protein